MKYFTIILISLFTLNLTAQCKKCTSISEAAKEPLKVVSLQVNPYLGGEPLHKFPMQVLEMKNLKILYLTDQNIREVPEGLGKLQNLDELSISGCPITEIPDDIFELKDLKEMVLYDTKFSEKYKKEIIKRFKKELPKTKLLID